MKTYLDYINLVIQTPYMANIDQMLQKALDNNYPHLFKADTIEELAAKTGMDRRRGKPRSIQRLLRPGL